MNKLPHEQDTHGTTEAQDGTDFYARITPDVVVEAAQNCPPMARDLARRMNSTTNDWWSTGWLAITCGLLHMLEQAERRADDLQRELSDVYALLPGSIYMDPPDGGDVHPREQMRRLAEDAKKYREKDWGGNISQDRQTLARGDMPPGGASEQDLLAQA